MTAHDNKILGEGLTYDDVLLVPAYSEVLPREVSIKTKFSRNITLNVPIASAAMDTVTESAMAIAIAREGGIGVLHKNMTIEQQAAEVRKVKRAESGMIQDPVTLKKDATVGDAQSTMREFSIGGIPITDAEGKLIGIVTNRDLHGQNHHRDQRASAHWCHLHSSRKLPNPHPVQRQRQYSYRQAMLLPTRRDQHCSSTVGQPPLPN